MTCFGIFMTIDTAIIAKAASEARRTMRLSASDGVRTGRAYGLFDFMPTYTVPSLCSSAKKYVVDRLRPGLAKLALETFPAQTQTSQIAGDDFAVDDKFRRHEGRPAALSFPFSLRT